MSEAMTAGGMVAKTVDYLVSLLAVQRAVQRAETTAEWRAAQKAAAMAAQSDRGPVERTVVWSAASTVGKTAC
jgi:hypothetical protein